MSDLLQSGYHPDADQLNAFVEHALPDHERQQTLAHLAVCPDCRAIVALSVPPVEVSAPEPFRKSWFSGWNLAWPVVAALAGLVAFFVHIRNVPIDRKGADAPSQVAISHSPPAHLPAPATSQVSNPKPPPVISEKRPPTSRRDEGAGSVISKNAKPAVDAKSLEGFPVQNRNLAGLAQGGPTFGATSLHGQLSPQAGNASGVGIAGIKTPAAPVDHLEQPPPGSNAASVNAPNRLIEAPAASGLYQLAPPPLPPASAAPAAALAKTAGGVTSDQTVEVAAAPTANLSTLSAEVALPSIGNAIPRQPLPSKLPILSMVSNAHRILAIDTHNAVFFSDNDGTTWNAVPAQWRGRAVKVGLAASANSSTFVSLANGSPLSAKAQGTSSALTGTVTDQSGAVIPDASVVVGNPTTPSLRTVKTDRMGHYLIDDLVPGNYRVEVDATGFIDQQRDVTLTATQQSLASFTLSVGSVGETVTVETAAEPVATLSVPRKNNAARSAANQSHPVDQSVFEMTTDTGERWTSIDGHTWKHQ